MNLLRRNDSRWYQALIWALVVTTVQMVVAPAAVAAVADRGSAYSDWLSDRGADGSDRGVEEALEAARAARHGSLESFVKEFVGILEAEGTLPQALALFSSEWSDGPATAEDLLEFLLADLRSLRPQSPVATARIGASDAVAANVGLRTATSERGLTTRLAPLSPVAFGPAVLSQPAFGLGTSIQSLGP